MYGGSFSDVSEYEYMEPMGNRGIPTERLIKEAHRRSLQEKDMGLTKKQLQDLIIQVKRDGLDYGLAETLAEQVGGKKGLQQFRKSVDNKEFIDQMMEERKDEL